MGKGRRSEHELSNVIYRRTEDGVFAWPIGYSGSNAVPCADVAVMWDGGLTGIELKNSDGDYVRVDESQCEQLLTIARSANWVDVALLIDASRREPLYVEPVFPEKDDLGPREQFVESIPDCWDPRLTEGGDVEEPKLMMTKPDLDDWPSAAAGGDPTDVALDGIGIGEERRVEAAVVT